MKELLMQILKASFNLSIASLKAIFLIIVTLILFCLFAKILVDLRIGF